MGVICSVLVCGKTADCLTGVETSNILAFPQPAASKRWGAVLFLNQPIPKLENLIIPRCSYPPAEGYCHHRWAKGWGRRESFCTLGLALLAQITLGGILRLKICGKVKRNICTFTSTWWAVGLRKIKCLTYNIFQWEYKESLKGCVPPSDISLLKLHF